MKLSRIFTFSALLVAATSLFSSCSKNDNDDPVTPIIEPFAKPNVVFYGLFSGNAIAKFNANAAQSAGPTLVITGLQPVESLVAIDFRPTTGQLVGITNQSRIYFINLTTGVATTPSLTPFTPAISGNVTGFDFNPTVDRIRVVTGSGQNLRVNPETGLVAATDANINPGTPTLAGAAYTNSTAGSTTTVLYDINLTTKKLVKQDPPNNGTLVDVGDLGIAPITGGDFDISPDNAVALAPLSTGGTSTGLYQINLTTGAATNLGNMTGSVIGIAIPPAPVAYAVSGGSLLIFNPNSPATYVGKTITGLTAETVVGIDMRPATGQLYGLTSSGKIVTINISTGAAVQVGAASLTLNGTSFGFDFNPMVDRIRIVSNTGQNLRVNPVDGTVTNDTFLSPGTPNISGAAYTNNFAGTAATMLYGIDYTTDKLYSFTGSPNAGVLAEAGSLGINVESGNGFDIGASGKAYGIFTVGAIYKIYTINLANGAATVVADFPVAVTGFAIGLDY